MYNALLDTIHHPAILLDPDYQVVAANKAYRQRYRFIPDDKPVYCYQISHGYPGPCDQQGESCSLQAAKQSGRPERVMHVHLTPEGKRHVDVQIEPVFDQQGQPLYYLEILREVTKPAGSLMMGESQAYNRMLLQLRRAADSAVSVLLLGESGTGKELAARFLHDSSGRHCKPFVTVECAGLTDSLFESELFGYVKGAFTGALSDKTGLIGAVDGGTLFLDEIGDVPLSQQVKLLRLIETGSYRPVGSVDSRHADFRLICATNKDLSALVSSGQFREDLFYRISSFPVLLPPLRQRTGDVELLAKLILQKISGNLLVHFSEQALDFLRHYDFPGNIRELRNMIERANLLRNDHRITLEHIRPLLRQPAQADQINRLAVAEIVPLDQLEQHYLQQLSSGFTGSKSELAARLGISERTLYRKLRQGKNC